MKNDYEIFKSNIARLINSKLYDMNTPSISLIFFIIANFVLLLSLILDGYRVVDNLFYLWFGSDLLALMFSSCVLLAVLVWFFLSSLNVKYYIDELIIFYKDSYYDDNNKDINIGEFTPVLNKFKYFRDEYFSKIQFGVFFVVIGMLLTTDMYLDVFIIVVVYFMVRYLAKWLENLVITLYGISVLDEKICKQFLNKKGYSKEDFIKYSEEILKDLNKDIELKKSFEENGCLNNKISKEDYYLILIRMVSIKVEL